MVDEEMDGLRSGSWVLWICVLTSDAGRRPAMNEQY